MIGKHGKKEGSWKMHLILEIGGIYVIIFQECIHVSILFPEVANL